MQIPHLVRQFLQAFILSGVSGLPHVWALFPFEKSFFESLYALLVLPVFLFQPFAPFNVIYLLVAQVTAHPISVFMVLPCSQQRMLHFLKRVAASFKVGLETLDKFVRAFGQPPGHLPVRYEVVFYRLKSHFPSYPIQRGGCEGTVEQFSIFGVQLVNHHAE